MAEKILLIGGSANGFGRETESDSASYQMVSALLKRGCEVFLIDDNPDSFTASRTDVHVEVLDLNAENLVKVIIANGITGIVPTVGGTTAIRLAFEVQQILGDQGPKVYGLSTPVLKATQNTKYLQERLQQWHLPAVQTRLASTPGEVFDAARELEFPVVVRSIAPQGQALRMQAEDAEELDQIAEDALARSLTHQVNVDKSIRGYKEIALIVMRDFRDTNVLIGGIEDMDPVGIHSADSIAITPIQTLADPVVQTLRHTAFKIARGFDIKGLLQVRFAVNPEDDSYVVTRLVPYYDRKVSLIEGATGYPMVPVMTGLMLGDRLEKVHIPSSYAEHTAMLEPTMDHVVMRFPVFTFGELELGGIETNRRLDTIQKSVGATIGVGRSLEEALEKALRAAHFSNRIFSPDLMGELTDSQVIAQLIHPQDNRILLLLEAIRRGYTVDELAELTHIDAFFFYKLQKIMQLEIDVQEHPWDIELMKKAKYYGLSDGLIAKLWSSVYDSVRRYRWDNNVLPTYKAFEPSAGEFQESVSQFYSTFETENESERLGQNTVLIIGTGAFRLGDGAAASYVMAMVSDEYKRQGYETVLMNNNPHDLTFIPQLSDKQYFEPLEISDIMNVVEVEQPTRIVVPGNRIKLINSLKAAGLKVDVIAREKYLESTLTDPKEEILINYFFDGAELHPIVLSHQTNRQVNIETAEQVVLRDLDVPEMPFAEPGLYQFVVPKMPAPGMKLQGEMRPMPFTHVAFLDKISHVDWLRILVRFILNTSTPDDEALLDRLPEFDWPYERAVLHYQDAEFKEHMNIQVPLDNGQFAMGVTYEVE
ncbi:carbamoyl-phosphate synthase (glutamine-hydrolyzing) [Weissella viridescens]|uniref:Carbamoyl-phosphate synthase large subunit n=1 Tax=Weissella viridescens TaxID=1629 RepID=A0A0R2HCM0_WEIVI|nr:carbamoyl phosphate synthase large subunit [Weissella viridescens]KRN47197.1 carbamoyl-phosphate synthase large subunit [Weissella viridescens]GEA94754.1 carbamoyl-phosphate synthase (glutamine-hydrolyzing) [Weissella viridescens]